MKYPATGAWGRFVNRSLLIGGSALVLTAGTLIGPAVASADVADHTTSVVSDDPADFTPDILDGEVRSIIEVGNKMVVAGSFTQVKEKGQSQPTLTRTGVVAFDATTGAIDPAFNPTLDGEVNVVIPDTDGDSVYVGGTFKTVNGTINRKMTRLDLATGQITSGFLNPGFNAQVNDLRIVHDNVIAAGNFTDIWGTGRTYLSSLDPVTGRPNDFMAPAISVPRKGDPNVYKIDATPDGSSVVAIGNFQIVDGQSRPQIAKFDTSGAQATLSDWRTPFYDVTKCHQAFWSYMRDLDIDPTGEFMVVTTTGAYGGAESPCDVEARFELDQTGQDIAPTWRSYTGGDTTYAVEVTDSTVYVGGHMRWMNNPWAGDRAGAGSVERPGIAALDPKTGVPYSWNPGRQPRGVGVFDILATDAGLWIGSDTDWVAGEQHRKLAFFPTGGSAVPADVTGELPNDVYQLSDTAHADTVSRTFLNGGTAGDTDQLTAAEAGSDSWANVRGATLIDDTVYAARANGSFTASVFDGTRFADAENIDLGYQSAGAAKYFGADTANITGMFFDPESSQLYYKKAGSSTLWKRGFNTESRIVDPYANAATGDSSAIPNVAGMFLSGDTLYFANAADGFLYSIGFVDGVVTGPAQLVNNTRDWRAGGLFVWNGEPRPAEASPIAAAEIVCAGLECSFDGSGSSDPDGWLTDWSWDFGDGNTAAGESATHAYAAGGTYSVTLTVTDNRGNTGQSIQEVTVDAPLESNIEFQGASTKTENFSSSNVSVPAAAQEGDTLLLFVTSNSDVAVSAPPAGWAEVGTQSGRQIRTTLYAKQANAGDLGAAVTVGFPEIVKSDLTLLAYSGVDATDPVIQLASAAETSGTDAHVTPDLSQGPATRYVLSYWADKTSSTTSWTAPAGASEVSQNIGAGGGRISSLAVGTSVDPAPAGTIAGLTATADSSTAKATMWSVSLRAAE